MRIRELRKTNPVAAHLRERRFELGLTQQEIAAAAGTSHTAISRLESGAHTPNLATLRRIAAVLDEELLVCFQRTVSGEIDALPLPPVRERQSPRQTCGGDRRPPIPRLDR